MKRPTPASRAARARRTLARSLISNVSSGSRSSSGSVGESGQVEDRVVAAQVVLAEIADVALHALDLGAGVQVAAG